VHTQPGAGSFWIQFLSSNGEGVTHSPACFSIKTTSWAGAIRSKLICVVSACTRVAYSRAGFGQKLLARLASEPTCTDSFCPNWSRLPWEGSLCRDFVTPQVTMGQFGQMFFPHRKLQNLCRFRQDCSKERLNKCSYGKNQLSTWTLTNF